MGFFRFLARCENLAAWFFFLFNNVALFRFSLEFLAATVIIYGALGVREEFEQRKADRGVRKATLLAQIAQTHALPDGKGLRAVKASVEILAREDVPMIGIDLSGAALSSVDLSGANLFGTNLSGANLSGADLRGANLSGADLSRANLRRVDLSGTDLQIANLRGAFLHKADLSNTTLFDADLRDADLFTADLRGANLRGARLGDADVIGMTVCNTDVGFTEAELRELCPGSADFHGTDLSSADLSSAVGLTQADLMFACAGPETPPLLPQSLVWNKNPCPDQSEQSISARGPLFADYP